MTTETEITTTTKERSIALAFAFTRASIADPSITDRIPSRTALALIPDDDPELAGREIEAGLAAVRKGRNVYFCHVRYAPDGALIVQQPEL